ncbi:hypothetical protein KI387_021467, partial [Taxus chinensis]
VMWIANIIFITLENVRSGYYSKKFVHRLKLGKVLPLIFTQSLTSHGNESRQKFRLK